MIRSAADGRYTVPELDEFSYQVDDIKKIVVARSGVRSLVLPLNF